MKTFHSIMVGVLAVSLGAVSYSVARADDDDWEDRWEDRREDLEERREEARERWEEAREDRDDRWRRFRRDRDRWDDDWVDDGRYYYSPRYRSYYRPYTRYDDYSPRRYYYRDYVYPQYDDDYYYDGRVYRYGSPTYHTFRYRVPYNEYYGTSNFGYYERPYGREGVRLGPLQFEWND